MKKLILALLLCPFAHLFSQEEAGLKNVIGGQFNFRSIKGASQQFDQIDLNGDNGRRYREFNAYPYAAWKVADHWLLGFRLGYGRGYEKRFSFNTTGTQYINYYSVTKGLRLIGRYYLRPAAKFGLFFEPTLGYLGTKTKQRNQGSKETYYHINNNEFNFMASPGLSYHLNERLGLLVRMGQVGYGFGKRSFENPTVSEDKYSNFFFDFNLSYIYWGVEYRWGGTKPKAETPATD